MTKWPAGFAEKYQILLGDEAPAFLHALEQPGQKGFRVNPLKAQTQLFDTAPQGRVPWGAWGYFGEVNGHSVDHTSGLIYSQEPSAQLVGEVAHPRPGEKVLDLAAAPGGKTTHLASFMNQAGLLISNEIFYKRAQILSENVERFGLTNTLVTNHAPEELSPQFPEYFDRIVLDAPCSGEGMFRKDPDAMQYWHPDYPAECARLQREILTEAVKMLKPGGELIYSTCTFAPEEDEQVIAWLLHEYADFEIVPIQRPMGVDAGQPAWADGNPALAGTARLFPHHLVGEGHFVARLHRRLSAAEAKNSKAPKLARTNLTAEHKALWQMFQQAQLQDYQPAVLVAFGDQLYALPAGTPDLGHLKVLRAGLHLGTFKKKRFEPSFALALAINPAQQKQVYSLNLEEWRAYVHGDVFAISEELPNGWYLLVMNGNGMGYGKLVNGQMKNFYPKGLRFQPRS
ncbi:RsmF rRNA methyltransferase first C-terminal domain-containing protein [Weissella kandleri]|uniref:RsmF rRNA methyltransferase first C-terminal domain-containing protein n=1 Tax=Weissella kandleri TaxID=1616 RepID=UPI00387E5780